MQQAKIGKLVETLVGLDRPDRRLDSLVTLIALGPPEARLDSRAGLDGWDILIDQGGKDAQVWLAADEVLYVTQFVDAAIELCDKACLGTAALVVRRAMASLLRRAATNTFTTDVGGLIARHIVAETLNEVLMALKSEVRRVA